MKTELNHRDLERLLRKLAPPGERVDKVTWGRDAEGGVLATVTYCEVAPNGMHVRSPDVAHGMSQDGGGAHGGG